MNVDAEWLDLACGLFLLAAVAVVWSRDALANARILAV